MLERIFKKDKNEKMELILEEKNIDEKTKNFLLGILYKIEVSYKDYKIAKAIRATKDEYIEELLNNIKEKCDKIKIVELNDNELSPKIQKQLEKQKIYIDDKNGIISYPIEEKILYAIQKKSNIVNDTTISKLITTGKNIDRTEVIRDFNGWSWTTINSEIENIEANLIYQILQILLGENVINNIESNYLKNIKKEISDKYGKEKSVQIADRLEKFSIINEANNNTKFKKVLKTKLDNLRQQIEEYKDTKTNIDNITNNKKKIMKELEIATRNKDENTKNELMEQLEKCNYLLKPENYIKERNQIIKQIQSIEIIEYNKKEQQQILIEFIQISLECFNILIQYEKEYEKLIERIYQLRYMLLLPFDKNKNIIQVKALENIILYTEDKLINKAISNDVLNDLQIEILRYIFKTRIIKLQDLYVKIIKHDENYCMQVFDENNTEENVPINKIDKIKINRKIKIFI